ncbi:MAG: response regulator [Anaerolineales bacterium]|nr:response regulator [Anaerolineales bacterium]
MVSRRKPRILIADHDRTFLDQLADRTLQMDMTVDFAEVGNTAIELIEIERYDLIVLEVGMPIHNGLEILAIAKEIHPEVPVLMIAFSGTQDWAEQALKEGAYQYLLRPLEDIKMFDAALHEGLKRNGAPKRKPGGTNEFYTAAMHGGDFSTQQKPVLEGSPSSWLSETTTSKTILPTPKASSISPIASLARRGKAHRKEREQRLEDVFSELADGVIELNKQGHILSCNRTARDWLVLEAKTPDKPISRFIQSLANTNITETKQIEVKQHNAQMIIKPIVDGEGNQRTIILIRQMSEVVKELQSEMAISTGNPQSTETSRVRFKNVIRKPIDDYPEEGFSFMLMLDKAKLIMKDELGRLLENSPIEWVQNMLQPEPEQIDPEMISAMQRRLTKINGRM